MIGVPLSGPGSLPSDVEVPANDVRRVAGTVKDANGNSIAAALVYVYQKDSGQLAGVATSAADGTWSLSVNQAPDGYYAICFVGTLAVTTGWAAGPYFTS